MNYCGYYSWTLKGRGSNPSPWCHCIGNGPEIEAILFWSKFSFVQKAYPLTQSCVLRPLPHGQAAHDTDDGGGGGNDDAAFR